MQVLLLFRTLKALKSKIDKFSPELELFEKKITKANEDLDQAFREQRKDIWRMLTFTSTAVSGNIHHWRVNQRNVPILHNQKKFFFVHVDGFTRQMNRPVSFPLAIHPTSISIFCIVCRRSPAGDLDGPTPSVVSPQGYGWVWTPTNV